MNHEELTGYENEPREHFAPLPSHLHSQYYHYERLSIDIQPELDYYRSIFKNNCSRLLELGCGTSIISSHLANLGFHVTGLDLNQEMLSFRPHPIANDTVQMDMCKLGFRPCFDGVLIPQNTLNLLVDESRIRQCLKEVKRILVPPGILAVHLYAGDTEPSGEIDKKMLQFHIFDLPTGEKIVKESITSRISDKNILKIEQRYKYRNFKQPAHNRNYRQFLELASFSTTKWLSLLTESGFTPTASVSNFTDTQKNVPSSYIVTARVYT